MVLSLKTLVIAHVVNNFQKYAKQGFSSLPSELRLAILKYCTDGEILLDEHLRILLDPKQQTVDISNCRSISYSGFRHIAETCAHSLKVVRLDEHTHCHELLSNSLKLLSLKCKQLEEISLRGCTVKDSYLATLFAECNSNLSHVNLSSVRGLKANGALKQMALKCPNLINLNLSHAQWVGASLGSILSNCKHLRSLNISFTDTPESELQQLAHGSNLTELDISGLVITSEAPLEKIASSCTNLTSLHMRAFASIQGTSLPILASKCTRLSTLSIGMCTDISPEKLELFASTLEKQGTGSTLTSLDLSGLKHDVNSALFILSKCCNRLEELNLSGVRFTHDNSLLKIISNGSALTQLDVSMCRQLTAKSLSLIPQYLADTLTEFHCYGCNFLKNDALEPLLKKCNKMKILNLYGVRDATDDAFKHIGDNMPQLEQLDISGCPNVTDLPIVKVALGCPNLKSLLMRNCPLLTDASVSLVLKNCPYMERLALNSCEKLTDVTLLDVATYGQHIKSLSVAGCSQFSDAAYRQLVSKSQILKLLTVSATSDLSETTRTLAEKLRPNLHIKFV